MNKKLELNNKIITTTDQWDSVQRCLSDCTVLSIDTEFMRERTYYPHLCLVQLASDDFAVCLDPLAIDFSKGLAGMLNDEKITKIMHSASQDIEVLGRMADVTINNLFDTQLAAEFAGISDQIGYSALVENMLAIDLPKSQTRSNWAKRPLTARQLDYSLNDVKYLIPLYEKLTEQLKRSNKYDWFIQEQCNELQRMSQFHVDADHAHVNFRASHRLDGRAQKFVKSLVNWRENIAQTEDKPKHWIIKDKVVTQIAEQLPLQKSELESILSQDPRFKKKYLPKISALIDETLKHPGEQVWSNKKQLSEAQKNQITELRHQIKKQAQHYNLPSTRLGTRKDMVDYVLNGSGRLAQGWRADILNLV